MKTNSQNKDDLRVSLPAGVKKLKKHGEHVIAVLNGICNRGIKQLKRNASALVAGLTSDAPDRKK